MSSKPPTLWIESAHREALRALAQTRHLDEVWQGFVAAPDQAVVRDARGRVVWSGEGHESLQDEPPYSVHPGLWSKAAALAARGLFEVVPGVYQVRGMDLTNMTLIEGVTGVIVLDPLRSTETAAAALALYRRHRGERPVRAVIYTSGRVDHFGGVLGVADPEHVRAGEILVLSPGGFLEQVAGESVLAAAAAPGRRRSVEGADLDPGPRGQVDAGRGPRASTGEVGLIPPVDEVSAAVEHREIDGVAIEFRQASGVGSRAGMHVLVPDRGVLYLPDDCGHLAYRWVQGPLPELRPWLRHFEETLHRVHGRLAAVVMTHHWPVRGTGQVDDFLCAQRDVLAYVHDQTVRLLGRGVDPYEIEEVLRLPPDLEEAWVAHGYRATVLDLVRAVAAGYLGGFDSNPAHLWPHSSRDLGRRYVEAVGGPGRVLAAAVAAYDDGDFRWAAVLLDHVVGTNPDDDRARQLYADALEQLGYGAANGAWRNIYLTGAQQLRSNVVERAGAVVPDGLPAAVLLDLLATRIDGPRAWHIDVALDFSVTDVASNHRVTVRRGVLSHRVADPDGTADAIVSLSHRRLHQLASGDTTPAGLSVRGGIEPLQAMLDLIDGPPTGTRPASS
jgi:alkyl sulfatase BDS1-like metallo-beta-lactamase superfamily hydrolase